MVFLLSMKERVNEIYNKYNTYIVPVSKFIIAFVSLMLLNITIGYMTQIKNPLIALVISAICAFLPSGFTIVVLSIFMLGHLYAISAEFAIIALCVVLVMYLLYFRFSPKYGYLMILTIIVCSLNVPFIIPVAVALSVGLFSIVPVSFGVIIYYIIRTASEYEAAISANSANSARQISYIVESFVSNKACIVLVIAMVACIAVTYFCKRRSVNNAWTYAIIVGTAVQFVIAIAGILVLDAKLNLVFMIIGVIAGAIVGYICQVVFFSVDYKRTEYVQYEDDEYYYYVKAVPKVAITTKDLKVKHINARNVKHTTDMEE